MDDLRRRALSLLDSHGYRLLRLMVRLTLRRDAAEDLFQELLVKLIKSPTWAQTADPVSYVFRMAINLASDWRRNQQKLPKLDVPDNRATSEPTPLEGLVHREELEQVLEALDELPEATRHCLVLRYFEEETAESIGQQLGKSAHHVRSICSKGLAALRKRLGIALTPEEEERSDG